MSETETLELFYQRKLDQVPEGLRKDLGHFNVFRLEDCYLPDAQPVVYSRRDFYKIALMRGRHAYHYADKSIEVDGSTLLFFNPQVPYTFEPLTENPSGYFCIFKEAFFSEHMRGSLRSLPMYAPGGKPAYMLDAVGDAAVSAIFQKMLTEMGGDYTFKFDLIRNYLMEMHHSALKLQPSETLYQHADGNARIAALFAELLERQFPIETPAQQLSLRSARDYAEKLHVHTNHLNRAVKTVTGKTTTEQIAERLTAEAMALLKHTDWNIAEISYCLGFEEPAHFSNFFRKHAQVTPVAWRGGVSMG
ncbi:AraC-type DNA-binding protein [Cnuella takakiae]|uniref:AraC-type DNA-binding protein n=1 Tax=Cnuella takakiae TaxID=1302690 RepID=A0A1M4ZJG7_9BACT|nr:helix-turn-helix domain-containing protein [Cnuella takakiae]OLY94190.1 AraC family transcriptional regulator [Cnuella takakiae]SHF18164.1 AraC-type DNA-binding protein [Cnuella takakiae]